MKEIQAYFKTALIFIQIFFNFQIKIKIRDAHNIMSLTLLKEYNTFRKYIFTSMT